MTADENLENNAKDIVLSFINALNDRDYETAGEFLSRDMQFSGVLGKRDGAEAYIQDMKHMQFQYDVVKTFADGNDVCLFYNIDMQGTKVFTSGWYQLSGGKIKSIKVVFDPRPVLENK
ncbi:MAG: nuclear transport factor 2 family protein [Sphingobacteriaceae bacterium]|nr:MAG: nuclear transport factor 2 family protein [Sphingobacteriaceae bacterium]